jgi:hypothetical protein
MDCRKRSLNNPYVNGPQDSEIHGNNHYARLPYLGPGNRATPKGIERLSDALEWLSYIYKARDKHGAEWEKEGQVFPASRTKRSKEVVITADVHQQADTGTVLRVATGDGQLDQLIAKTQHMYRTNRLMVAAVPQRLIG